ncbi:hypothetical protein EBU94_06770 [bacterium]|nr:hypothetical protein [bacterium]
MKKQNVFWIFIIMTEKMKQVITIYMDSLFKPIQFDKEEFQDESVYMIYSEDYTINIVKLTTRINVSAELFHKLHVVFGVGYGDLSDFIREYLSKKLDYDFSLYPTVPSL